MNYLLVLAVEYVFLFCSGESIKVFVRVRPPDPHLESEIDEAPCLEVTSPSSLTVHSKPEPKHFTFDHVANMHTTQVCTPRLSCWESLGVRLGTWYMVSLVPRLPRVMWCRGY